MRCNVISLLIGCVVIAVTALPERKDELEKPLIDFLTLDYLSVAQTIWLTIETHADRQSTLARINDEHQRFFGSDFGETASLRHAYYVPLDAGNSHEYQYYSQFINNLQRLDSNFATASNVAQSLATQNESAIGMAIDRFERDIYVHSVQLSDSIFEEVSAARFWNKGKSYIEFCTNGTTVVPIESEFQLVYNYYKDVRSALLKGYILTQFSLMLLAVKNLGKDNKNYQQHHKANSAVKRDEFLERNTQIQRNIKNLLKIADRDTWNCDPRPTANSHSYDQVTNFLQGYIDNEVNFNTEDSCKLNCGDYTKTKNYMCAPETLCGDTSEQNRPLAVCKGNIRECVDLGDIDTNVCHTTDPLRRYNFIKYSNGKIIGLRPSPDRPCEFTSKAKTWRRWFVKCSSCFCFCDDPSHSDRHFSLHEVVSDIQQNKVVTGVRIVKPNGVFQFAISQRTLRPFGQTDASEQNTWKLADYQFKVDNETKAIDSIDYFTLTYENRSINLDELSVPRGKVVTGVRFYHHKGHVVLQIRATDFNYFSGQLLNLHYTPWVTNTAGGETEIDVTSRANPLEYGEGVNEPIAAKPNQFVVFRPSDFETDAAQSTVPFIETLPLESKNPVVLTGVALALKAQMGSGGIVAPKLITYDFQIADKEPTEEFDYID